MAKRKPEGETQDSDNNAASDERLRAPEQRERKTSRQLRAAAAASRKKTPLKPVQVPAAQGRPVTATHWARGRQHDALVVAFVSEHGRQRTVKRTPAEWMNLFREWLKQPR